MVVTSKSIALISVRSRGREALDLLDDTDDPQRQAIRERIAAHHVHQDR
ncbi:hypothetical protein ACFWRG_28975 [Micromonospora tulbaghiae]